MAGYGSSDDLRDYLDRIAELKRENQELKDTITTLRFLVGELREGMNLARRKGDARAS